MREESEPLEILRDLVAIDSVNPEWGGPGEKEVSDYLGRFFRDADIPFWVEEVLPGRFNLYARIAGSDSSRAVLLEAHTDVVSVSGMTIPPFDPEIREGRLYGRGSCDTKGGLAAMVAAMKAIRKGDRIPPLDVWLAAVVDEEHAFRGVLAALEWFRNREVAFAGALVAEPTELALVTTNKGVLRWRIETLGRAAHSSKPWLGENAISSMAALVARLDAFHEELAGKTHPLVGPATCNIGTISGGDQVNFVPERCTISLDRRMLPGESVGEILDSYRVVLDSFPAGTVRMLPPDLSDEAMETPTDSEVFRSASAVMREMGREAVPVGVPFGCDATKLSRAGIPSLIFGPGSIDQAHAAVEWVEVNQVEFAFDFYLRFLLNYGG